MQIFKSTDRSDRTIYFTKEDIEIDLDESSLKSIPIIYHVKEVKTKQEADYSITSKKKTVHFKFSSKEALEANKKSNIIKTIDINAVTSPACLIAKGFEDRVEELDITSTPAN